MTDEAVRIVFERDGQPLAVDDASADGIRLFGETAAWPHRTIVTLRPRNAATRAKRDRVIRRLGAFRLVAAEASGHVVLTGQPNPDGNANENLPSGFWDFTLNVYPFGRYRRTGLRVPSNGQVEVRVPLGREPGSIDVLPPSGWDAEIGRVLDASLLDESRTNGWHQESGSEWIQNGERWARRRACVLNVLAVARELSLVERIRRVFFAEVDRVYAQVDPGFDALLDAARFDAEGTPGHPIHRRLLDALEVDPDEWSLASFRHKRNPSLQLVVAREKVPTGSDPPTFVELDIDRGHVALDLVGFFTHLAELAHPGRTDHIALYEKLEETPAAPFLAYRPVSA